MKHTIKVTTILVMLFLFSQVFGLFTVTRYISAETTEDGQIEISHSDTVIGEQPVVPESQKNYSFLLLAAVILIGTLILLALIKINLGRLWKYWFFLAVFLSMSITIGVYMRFIIALMIGLALAFLKVFKKNVLVHNLTEPLVYTGIAIMILPWLNVLSASILLVIISLYDMYAVWKSKHMVTLAKFQTKEKAFAGLMLKYPEEKKKAKADQKAPEIRIVSAKTKRSKPRIKDAFLGGGDIAFPLLFSAAVLESLVKMGIPKYHAFFYVLIISLFSSIALLLIFVKAKKDKFYPAMPFISLGCLVGYAIVYLTVLI